ncbi:uncharacterized protein (DUF305 family) [Sphingomonas jejuensis]|uniref:Uncharacterized protein (DUF305 family) n=1 Tax=Sphingomonas jejuensis TaxID=904715 RepID=A0ABX0XHC6_9SPHN|nr:DUF305 domain-containing protein [Sphingomonas jejuensis]NJC32614.1 uncharacterized protein (DUF305 family) [Sphingomonas jejuensis]
MSFQSRSVTAALAASLFFAAPAMAQAQGHQGMNHGSAQQAGGHGDMARQEYMAAMQQMNERMMAANDPDPDRAFALKMIEHHRGGIAMSEIEIRHGDDAEAKRMAQKTADMQRKEIAELENWLRRHGSRPAAR